MPFRFVVDGESMDVLDLSEGLHWIEVYNEEGVLNAELLHVQEGSFVQLPQSVVPYQHNRRQAEEIALVCNCHVLFECRGIYTHCRHAEPSAISREYLIISTGSATLTYLAMGSNQSCFRCHGIGLLAMSMDRFTKDGEDQNP